MPVSSTDVFAGTSGSSVPDVLVSSFLRTLAPSDSDQMFSGEHQYDRLLLGEERLEVMQRRGKSKKLSPIRIELLNPITCMVVWKAFADIRLI